MYTTRLRISVPSGNNPQTPPACDLDERFTGTVAGLSLHAGVATKGHERKKLERLCRYVSRPAVSEKRLSLTPNGNIRYQLETPYRDGTTHVIFEPLDFVARLAALVPKPRVNLTRSHGVFALNSKHRASVTPAKRGKGSRHPSKRDSEGQTPAERRAAMTWAQRLKRAIKGLGSNLQITFKKAGKVRSLNHVMCLPTEEGRSRSSGRGLTGR